MLGRRARLPVLAEISGPPEEARAWSLRRSDYESLEGALPRLGEARVVLVSGEGEAPLPAAIALAAASAAAGRRTILLECDLGRPRLAAQIGLAAAPGVHEYLRWEAEPADVLQPVMLAGLAAGAAGEPLVCVCAGRPASNTETLLGLQSFAHMIEKLRGAYELVVVVAPPVMTEPAACAAGARQADAVVAADEDGSSGKAVKRLGIPAVGRIVVG
jgi:Mrp family chromosome partitioning ATPase